MTEKITITIKHLSKKDFKVSILPTASILELKEEIKRITEIPEEN